MTRRGGQWELLDRPSDPVPAGPEDVERVARDFRTNGETMTNAAHALKRLAGGSGWKGEAAKAFAEKADEAWADLEKAASKYVDAGQALTTFTSQVATARDETAAALRDAVEADSARQQNATSGLDGVDDPTDAQKDADDARQDRHDDAVAALDGARQRLDHAMEVFDRQAAICANEIASASDNFKDGTMDDIRGAVSSALKVLVDALNVIAFVLAVVIIILVVFTTIAIGPLLLAAFILGAVIFALTTVQYAMGDASLSDVLWSTLGMLGGGVGRLGGATAKAATTAARSSLVARSGRQAARALPRSVRFGRFVPFKPIRAWANGIRNPAIQTARRTTADAIDGTARSNVGLAVAGVEDIANTYRSIAAMRGMNPGLINSMRLSVAQGSNHVALAGSTAELTAQVHDSLEVNEKVRELVPGISDFGSQVGDVADGQPDRTAEVPPAPAPLPPHLTPAGRTPGP